MKKLKKIIALVLTVGLTFQCLTISGFAYDENVDSETDSIALQTKATETWKKEYKNTVNLIVEGEIHGNIVNQTATAFQTVEGTKDSGILGKYNTTKNKQSTASISIEPDNGYSVEIVSSSYGSSSLLVGLNNKIFNARDYISIDDNNLAITINPLNLNVPNNSLLKANDSFELKSNITIKFVREQVIFTRTVSEFGAIEPAEEGKSFENNQYRVEKNAQTTTSFKAVADNNYRLEKVYVDGVETSFDENGIFNVNNGKNVTLSAEYVEKDESEIQVKKDITWRYTTDFSAIKNTIYDCIDLKNSNLDSDATVDDFEYFYKYSLTSLVNDVLGITLPALDKFDQNIWIKLGSDASIESILNDNISNSFNLEIIKGLLKAAGADLTEQLTVLPVGEGTIKIAYIGDKDYKPSEKEFSVNIIKGKVKIKVNSTTIDYGEIIPNNLVVTDPTGVNKFVLYLGIDTDVTGYASLVLPNGLAYDVLGKLFPNGFTVNDLTKVLEVLNLGINSDVIDKLLNELPDSVKNFKVEINKQPQNAGLYTVAGITADSNYNTAFGLGTLLIKQNNTELTLKFNQEIKGSIVYSDRYNFNFGGKLYNKEGTVVDGIQVRTLYTGFSSDGKYHTNTKPILEPGVYTETVYTLGSNYAVKPITRVYTIRKETVQIKFDNYLNVETYDGTSKSLIGKVYDKSGNAFIDAKLVYKGVDNSYNSTIPPTAAGRYRVVASYSGDDTHYAAIPKVASLVIKKADKAIVTVNDINNNYGEEYKYSYSLEGVVARDIDTLVSSIVCVTDNNENVGNHKIKAIINEDVAKNYKEVVVVKGKHTITPKAININIDNINTTYGDDEKVLTFSLAVDSTLAYGDTLADLGITLERESGNDVGEYKITGDASNENYDVTFTDGTYTIASKKVQLIIDDKMKVEGEIDPEFTYNIIGLVNGDIFAVELTREPGEKAGKYVINGKVEGANNYNLEIVTGTLTVNAKTALPVKPVDKGTPTGDNVDLNTLIALAGISALLLLIILRKKHSLNK